MNKSGMFMEEAIRICKETDFVKLHQSLNGDDETYGKEVLGRLMEAHRRLLGEFPLPDEEEGLVPFPAKIAKKNGGTVWLGICPCHVISLSEDTFLFELLHGHLIQVAGIMFPAEYKAMGYDPSDLFADGSTTIIVYSGDREITEEITQGGVEKIIPEEKEEEAFHLMQ